MDEYKIFKNIIESDRITPLEKAVLRMAFDAWVDPVEALVDETVKESICKHSPEGYENDGGMYDACRRAASDAMNMAVVMLDKSICRAIDKYVDDDREYKEEETRMEWEYQASRL